MPTTREKLAGRTVDHATARQQAIELLVSNGWRETTKGGRGSLRFDKGERRACVSQFKVTFRLKIMGRGNRPQDWREERIIDIRSIDEIRQEATRNMERSVEAVRRTVVK